MIQRIKTWFSNYKEKRRRERILNDIKKAKLYYLKGVSRGMCGCFYLVDKDKYHFCDCISRIIPEYTPETLGSTKSEGLFWWSVKDRESRIRAFDKLIEIYSK